MKPLSTILASRDEERGKVMKRYGGFLRFVFLIQCMIFLVGGCIQAGLDANTRSVIQNAIDELAQQPDRWNAVLTDVVAKVGGETRTTITSLANEMTNVGVEGRCTLDFVGQRVKTALQQILDNNRAAYALSPWVCHMRPESFYIDQAGHDTDNPPLVTISGFGFAPENIASAQLSVVDETGRNIVQNLDTSPNFVSAYRITVNIQDIEFPLQPRNKLRLTWTADNYYSEAAILVAQNPPTVINICYSVHLQGTAWQPEVCDNSVAGTTGQARQMEAIRIRLVGAPAGMGVCYTPYLQNIGWSSEVCNNSVAGTTGENRRMEAIKIRLVGAPAGMSVCYNAYLQDLEWETEVCDDEMAGTTNQGRRIEAIKVRLVSGN